MHITHALGHRLPERWLTAAATLAAAFCISLAAVGPPPASAAGHTATGSGPDVAARAQTGSFTPGRVGDLDYYLYAPSVADGSRALPLVVYLHGCHQTAPDAAVGTRWNEQADADGFLVLYPQQSPERAASRC
jgi:poly(3-hydroxybutyrate) depolymerase